VEIAAQFGEEILIQFISPTGDEYNLMDDTTATDSNGMQEDDFTLGSQPGNPGTLAFIAPYIFVNDTGLDFTAPHSPPNIYNAEDWGTQSMYAAGNWSLSIVGQSALFIFSIGEVTINYCADSCRSTVTNNEGTTSAEQEQCNEADLDKPDIFVPPVETECPSCFACLSSCSDCVSSPADCVDFIDANFCNECSDACKKGFKCGCEHDFQANANATNSNDIFDFAFSLQEVTFIEAIEVELAHWYASDLEITLTAPDGTKYIPMFDNKSVSNSESFKLGAELLDQSTQSTLLNVAPYMFVAAGGVSAFPDGLAPSGAYNAHSWGSGPHASGEWKFSVNDDTILLDPTSIGRVTIKYCGQCDQRRKRRHQRD